MIITRRCCDHDGRTRAQLEEGDAAAVVLPSTGRVVDGQVFTVRPYAPGHLEVEIIVADGDLRAVEVAALEEMGVAGAG